jgi:molybdenum cofactor biosynthesis enzyme MoaA
VINRYSLPLAIFNITNSCNLNCNGCIVGSNFEYHGHQSWQEQKPKYEKWSKKIDIKRFEIYGGEPLLNPEWADWFQGIGKLWPDATGWLLSNGYAISSSKNQKLYDLLAQSKGKYWLEISHHNENKKDWIIEQIYKFLNDDIILHHITHSEVVQLHGLDFNKMVLEDINFAHVRKTIVQGYNDVRDADWPEIDTIEEWNSLPAWIRQECDEMHNVSLDKILERYKYDYIVGKFTDSNGVSVILRQSTEFWEGVLSVNKNHVAFHNSDVNIAHDACNSKMCSEFYNGEIHKCNPVGHFKEWSEQLPMELTARQQQLIDSYVPTVTADSTIEEIENWFDHERTHAIPQCGLCPEERNINVINATTKKIKFVR